MLEDEPAWPLFLEELGLFLNWSHDRRDLPRSRPVGGVPLVLIVVVAAMTVVVDLLGGVVPLGPSRQLLPRRT